MTALLDLAELLVQAYAECAREGATVEARPFRPAATDKAAVPHQERITTEGERPWAS